MKINPEADKVNFSFVMSQFFANLKNGDERQMNKILVSAPFAQALEYWFKSYPESYGILLERLQDTENSVLDKPFLPENDEEVDRMLDLIDEARGLEDYLRLHYPLAYELHEKVQQRRFRRLDKLDKLLLDEQ